MAFTNFPAFAGARGSLIINGYSYPAYDWEYDTHSSSIPFPTASSVPYVDMRPGMQVMTLRATGACRQTFNLFSGVGIAYLNTYCQVRVVGLDGHFLADCPSALVTQWKFHDVSDGYCQWQLTCMGNFKFQNMGNRYDPNTGA